MKYKQYYITYALPLNSEAGEENYAERAGLSALTQLGVAKVVRFEDGPTERTLEKFRVPAMAVVR